MTDHSILRPAVPDLPFKEEARLVTRVLSAIFVEFPRSFAMATRAQSLYDDLYNLDSPGLAALGVKRDEIGRYVLARTGMINPKSE